MTVRIRHIVYWLLGSGALGVVAVEAPRGAWLSTTPERGKVSRSDGKATIRGRGPAFIWLGGGYHGGK
jgi:hypothetical protein